VTPYASWSPATDTTELPSALRGALAPTVELRLLDLRPPVSPTATRNRRRVWRRAARCAIAHLTASARAASSSLTAYVLALAATGLVGLVFTDSVHRLGADLLAAALGVIR
jgi:hypothetical protein